MSKPTDSEITTRGLAWLREGVLPSLLPAYLMLEFNITRGRAIRLAQQALLLYKLEKGQNGDD